MIVLDAAKACQCLERELHEDKRKTAVRSVQALGAMRPVGTPAASSCRFEACNRSGLTYDRRFFCSTTITVGQESTPVTPA